MKHTFFRNLLHLGHNPTEETCPGHLLTSQMGFGRPTSGVSSKSRRTGAPTPGGSHSSAAVMLHDSSQKLAILSLQYNVCRLSLTGTATPKQKQLYPTLSHTIEPTSQWSAFLQYIRLHWSKKMTLTANSCSLVRTLDAYQPRWAHQARPSSSKRRWKINAGPSSPSLSHNSLSLHNGVVDYVSSGGRLSGEGYFSTSVDLLQTGDLLSHACKDQPK